jgi:hypothetical protein
MNKKDNFKFFVPLEIEKAKNAEGKEVMKIAGIASTIDRDSDGEVLDPSGFDLSYFMNNGFINWHHQAKDKPEAIIGEPTKAEIRKEGLYVEGELYPESKLAQQVYELAKGLEKSSKSRRLGFSIEGKVIERDLLDERFVKKAKITGLAITPTPKNSNTILDIIKGNFNDFDDELLDVNNIDSNGGSTTILDVLRPNGDRITVDSNYKIKVISKSASTENAGILSPASVDDDLKNLQKSTEEEQETDLTKNKKKDKFAINKSEIFVELLKATDNAKLSKSIINKIKFKDMSKPTISIDQLQKALTDIGVDVDMDLLKANIQEEAENKEKTELEKAIEAKQLELEQLKTKHSEIVKGKVEVEDSKKPEVSNEEEEEEEEETEEVEKGKDSKATVAEVKKEVEEKMEGKKSEEIEKGLNDTLEKSIDSKLQKGQDTLLTKFEELFKGFTEKIDERLSHIENQPGQRKSAASLNFIEKSFGGADDKQNENKTSLSLSRQRQQISNVLLAKSGIEKGETNEFYANAMMQFEATSSLSKAVMQDLYTNENILITQ